MGVECEEDHTIFEIDGGAGCEVDKGYSLAFEIVGTDHGHLNGFRGSLQVNYYCCDEVLVCR